MGGETCYYATHGGEKRFTGMEGGEREGRDIVTEGAWRASDFYVYSLWIRGTRLSNVHSVTIAVQVDPVLCVNPLRKNVGN